jgi:hypothetical protein
MIVEVFQEVLGCMYPSKETLRVVVCTTDPKPKKENTMHHGAHLHWRDLIVNTEIARNIRHRVIRALRKKLGNIGWKDIYDASVYGKAGLRMKGSMKMVTCQACKRDPECVHCGGRGRVKDPRVYMPSAVYGLDMQEDPSLLERLKSDMGQLVDATSVRAQDPPDTPVDTGEPSDEEEDDDDGLFAQAGRTQVKVTESITGSLKPECKKALEACLKAFPVLAGHLCHITSIKKCGNDYAFFKTSCHFCPNKCEAHGKNTIYFYCNRKSLILRCFSHNSYNGVCCSTYRQHSQTPRDLANLIFGEEAKPAASGRASSSRPESSSFIRPPPSKLRRTLPNFILYG